MRMHVRVVSFRLFNQLWTAIRSNHYSALGFALADGSLYNVLAGIIQGSTPDGSRG